jgi:hypothetical protein
MTDVSPGPGWWIASDGKWYAPELHPSVRDDCPPPADPSAPPLHRAAPVPSATTTVSTGGGPSRQDGNGDGNGNGKRLVGVAGVVFALVVIRSKRRRSKRASSPLGDG